MSLAILNVGEGDTKITFDKDKPGELERARRVVADMLKLGYAILVHVGETKGGKPKYRRATGFDPKHDEYIVTDAPAEPVQRVPVTARAVAVSRSAGGMSDRADSIEAQNQAQFENLERFDDFAVLRNKLRALAAHAGEWAGLPMPLQDMELVVEPRYPLAHVYKPKPIEDGFNGAKIRNRFYSIMKRRDVVVWQEPNSEKVTWGCHGTTHHFDIDVQTMAASEAWGIEQEGAALQTLAGLLPHHAFKRYLLSGMFVEQSERSGVYYFFRKLKPTVAASAATGSMKIIATLCQHPIAYYAGSWAGAMTPTDDVIAHLMLMRGDEALYWRRCNQHPAFRPEAGL